MNLMVWLNLMASVVLQGLFPPRVDSPLLPSSNRTSDLEAENTEETELVINELITSTLADGFVTLIATFDAAAGDVKPKKTDDKTVQEEEFFKFTGRFT